MVGNKRAIILLFLNMIFYAIYDLKYVPIVIFEIIGTYFIYCQIQRNSYMKKMWLIIGVILEVSILCFFKFVDLFLESSDLALRILMPLGISYYTFKILSFIIDTYRGRGRNYKVTLLEYAVYVSFFPQIVCGPISRTDEIIPQLSKKYKVTEHELMEGISMILSGGYKKVVIADRLAVYTAAIFTNPLGYPALASWLAAFFFSVQIYCDFAGYSELAIGVCKILGFHCHKNFDNPYFAANIKEFWNRWHISLSTWLRDYVYIPLGGNKVGKVRKKFNIMVTFLVSGIWHGVGLNYLCWGAYHGLLNILSIKKSSNKIILLIQTIGTFICVTFGWIMFHAGSFTNGIRYIQNMFTDVAINYNVIVSSVIPFTGDYSSVSYFLIVVIFIIVLFIFELREYTRSIQSLEKSLYSRSAFYLFAIMFFGIIGQNSFLYANF
ncbi:MAG: MBOAT family protein [Lachnospiraceae bacterium]|nr:MBOAT family protein [Lachnospiraceae bacterium]